MSLGRNEDDDEGAWPGERERKSVPNLCVRTNLEANQEKVNMATASPETHPTITTTHTHTMPSTPRQCQRPRRLRRQRSRTTRPRAIFQNQLFLVTTARRIGDGSDNAQVQLLARRRQRSVQGGSPILDNTHWSQAETSVGESPAETASLKELTRSPRKPCLLPETQGTQIALASTRRSASGQCKRPADR